MGRIGENDKSSRSSYDFKLIKDAAGRDENDDEEDDIVDDSDDCSEKTKARKNRLGVTIVEREIFAVEEGSMATGEGNGGGSGSGGGSVGVGGDACGDTGRGNDVRNAVDSIACKESNDNNNNAIKSNSATLTSTNQRNNEKSKILSPIFSTTNNVNRTNDAIINMSNHHKEKVFSRSHSLCFENSPMIGWFLNTSAGI